MTARLTPAPAVEDVLPGRAAAGPVAEEVAAGEPSRSASAPVAASELVASLDALHGAHTRARVDLNSPGTSTKPLPRLESADGLGDYVQHLMQEAQAAAETYRREAESEANQVAAEIVAVAALDAKETRDRAQAEAQAILDSASGILAERVGHITHLTDRLIRLAESVVDDSEAAETARVHALRLISALVTAADTAAAYLAEQA